jgi:hypothetical protein
MIRGARWGGDQQTPSGEDFVAALGYSYSLSGKSLEVRAAAQTDALGEYRLFDLPPGTYYLPAEDSRTSHIVFSRPTSQDMAPVGEFTIGRRI